jgi:hypothetical protein
MYSPEEIKEAGLDDFRVYLANLWDFLSLPSPTPVQYDLAYHLQHGPRRQIIQGFRGVGKSWVTVGFATWSLLLDPQKKVIMVSAGQTIADDLAKFAHTIIMEWDILGHLRPRRDQKTSSLHFDVGPALPSKDPSLKAVGITGQITSSRGDLIIPDDIEIPKNSYTHNMREKLSELVKEFDAVLKPGGRVVYLGTPQVEATLYNRLEKRGYERTVWPAEIPEHPHRYRGRLAPSVTARIEAGEPVGSPVDPTRFNEQELFERKLSYGATGYALQFMLDTTPSAADQHPLKTKDLILYDTDLDLTPVKLVWGQARELVQQDVESGGFDGDFYVRPAIRSEETSGYQGTVMAIDPSGQGKDETAYAIVAYAHGMQYLLASGGFVDGYSQQTMESLAALMHRWKVKTWISERNYGGGMFDKLLLPVCSQAGVKASHDEDWKSWSVGNKEMRILNVLEPLIQAHRLVINRQVVIDDLRQQADKEKYSLIYQMTRIARVKGALAHDDRVEALAMAAGYWQDLMSKDTEKSVEKHKGRLIDVEIRKYLKSIGKRGPRSGWRGDRK